jgi:hypothetical protein
MRIARVSCRPGGKFFSYFFRSQSLFISRGVDDGKGHPSYFGGREGEGCMKDTDHPIRHPRGHLGDRASAQRTRGCAWHDDQFGREQNTVLGWSDPTFCHWLVAKRPLGSLQPNQSDERSKHFVQTGIRAIQSFPVAPDGHPHFSSSCSTIAVEVKSSSPLYFIGDFANHFTGARRHG